MHHFKRRMYHSSILTDSKLLKCGPVGYKLFTALISLADDKGRGSADPDWLFFTGAFGHPTWNCTVEDLESVLRKLEEYHLVYLYQVNGDRVYILPKWFDHQKITSRNNTPTKFPNPPEWPEVLEGYAKSFKNNKKTPEHNDSAPEPNDSEEEHNDSAPEPNDSEEEHNDSFQETFRNKLQPSSSSSSSSSSKEVPSVAPADAVAKVESKKNSNNTFHPDFHQVCREHWDIFAGLDYHPRFANQIKGIIMQELQKTYGVYENIGKELIEEHSHWWADRGASFFRPTHIWTKEDYAEFAEKETMQAFKETSRIKCPQDWETQKSMIPYLRAIVMNSLRKNEEYQREVTRSKTLPQKIERYLKYKAGEVTEDDLKYR